MTEIKCLDAISTTKWMLSKSGVWPLKRMNHFDWFKLMVNWTYALSLVIMMIIEILNVWKDYQKLAEILGTIFPYGTYGCKLVALAYNRKYFFSIMEDINSTIFNSHAKELQKPIVQIIWISRTAEKIFKVLLLLLLVIYLVFPVLDHNALPIPFSYELGNYYYLMHWYQMTALTLTAWNISCIDLLFTSFTGLAAAQIDILRTKLIGCKYDESITRTDLKFNQEISVRLQDCIKLHIAIIRFLEHINGVFSEVILVQYVSGMILICNFFMQLCFLVDPLSTQFAWSCSFLIVILTELLLYHWFGNEVIVKSNRIGEACYLAEWYKFSCCNKKMIFILMERAKRPLSTTIYKFTEISLASFGMDKLKDVFSYLIVSCHQRWKYPQQSQAIQELTKNCIKHYASNAVQYSLLNM